MPTEEERRETAIRRLKAKRGFMQNLAVYLIVNAFLVALWFVTSKGEGHFWPLWVMLGWGLGLVFHGWAVFGGGGITEADVQREMQRGPDTIE